MTSPRERVYGIAIFEAEALTEAVRRWRAGNVLRPGEGATVKELPVSKVDRHGDMKVM